MYNSNINYNLKISGDNFSHEQKIDGMQLAKIISFLLLPMSNLTRSEDTEIPVSITDSSPKIQHLSAGEYINDKNPTTNPEKIAVFLLYIRETMLQEVASREEIIDLFERARQVMPKNFKRDLDKAISFGWVDYSKENGKYRLTISGEEAINTGFKTKIRKVGKKKNGSGKKISVEISDNVLNLEVKPNIEGVKDYWSLTKGERIIWLLLQAKLQNIESLNLKEIEKLSAKMNDNIRQKDIPALIESQNKKGRVHSTLSSSNIRILKILQPGIDFLKSNVSN